jgi:hypothetical protein
MSEAQIHQILKAMTDQNKVLADIQLEQTRAKTKIEAMEAKLEPVHQIFESVTGFNNIAIWLLKALVLLGAGIGVVYGFLKYLKQ